MPSRNNTMKYKYVGVRSGARRVSTQILRWRKSRKQLMQVVERPRIRSLRKAKAKKAATVKVKAFNMFDDDSES